MKELLEQKHLSVVDNTNKIMKCLNEVKTSYKYVREYVGSNWGYVKFNGLSKLSISHKDGAFYIELSGFGFRNALGATLSPCYGCSDIGTITKSVEQLDQESLRWIANNLAEFDKIYPI